MLPYGYQDAEIMLTYCRASSCHNNHIPLPSLSAILEFIETVRRKSTMAVHGPLWSFGSPRLYRLETTSLTPTLKNIF